MPIRPILRGMTVNRSHPPDFHVVARWDAEARVFYSESDVPGLVVEADTFDEFVDLVQHFVPELLKENGFLQKQS